MYIVIYGISVPLSVSSSELILIRSFLGFAELNERRMDWAIFEVFSAV
jgi:hypothetical protein